MAFLSLSLLLASTPFLSSLISTRLDVLLACAVLAPFEFLAASCLVDDILFRVFSLCCSVVDCTFSVANQLFAFHSVQLLHVVHRVRRLYVRRENAIESGEPAPPFLLFVALS